MTKKKLTTDVGQFGGWARNPQDYRYGDHAPIPQPQLVEEDTHEYCKITLGYDSKRRCIAWAFGKKLKVGDTLEIVAQSYSAPIERYSYFPSKFPDAVLNLGGDNSVASHQSPQTFMFSQDLKRWTEAPVYFNERTNEWFVSSCGKHYVLTEGLEVRRPTITAE